MFDSLSGRVSACSLAVLLIASSASAQQGRQIAGPDLAPQDEVIEIPLDQADVTRLPADVEVEIEAFDPDADDPPALLDDNQLVSMKDLAQRMSADRSWLRTEILRTLDFQHLRLDEVFVEAPELVRVGEELYRVQLEQSGNWDGFDPEVDPFFVYLTHEVYDGLGEDRALAFVDGAETVMFEFDLAESPSVAVTLLDLPSNTRLTGAEKVVSIHSSFSLGAAELRLPLERLPVHLYPELHQMANLGQRYGLAELAAMRNTLSEPTQNSTTCTQEVAPQSCSGYNLVCPTGYSPYFVLDQLMIKTDHEGLFKGNSEIELFPLRIDVASMLGSSSTASTNLLFYGQNVTDMAGRTRYLPNVVDTYRWYTVTNGVAIFPTDKGLEFSALLVEQDDDRGVLRVNATKVNVTKLYKQVTEIVRDFRQMDLNFLIKVGKLLLDIIGIFNDGDDLYQDSIGVANKLFCTDSVGQMKSYYLTSQEWEMRGHFACINPSCPDPGSGGTTGGGGGGTIDIGCLVVGDTTVDCR